MYINPQRKGTKKTHQWIIVVIASREAIRALPMVSEIDVLQQMCIHEFIIKHIFNNSRTIGRKLENEEEKTTL